jgi:hypothetical protein
MYGRVSKISQNSPASFLHKHAPPHHALTGGDTALKQLARLLKARRRLRQQHIAVHAIRPTRAPCAQAQRVAARRPPTPRRPDPRRGTAAQKRAARCGSRSRSRSRRDRSPSQHQYRSSRTSPLPAWSVVHYPGFPNETSRCPYEIAWLLSCPRAWSVSARAAGLVGPCRERQASLRLGTGDLHRLDIGGVGVGGRVRGFAADTVISATHPGTRSSLSVRTGGGWCYRVARRRGPVCRCGSPGRSRRRVG